MIKLIRNGYDVHIKKDDGSLEKLHINMQITKNNGTGLPVVNIEKYSLGRKWVSLSKLEDGKETIIPDEELYSKSNGPLGSRKNKNIDYSKALSKEDFEEFEKIKNRLYELEEIAQKRWNEIAEKITQEEKEKKNRLNNLLKGKISGDDLSEEEKIEIMNEIKMRLGKNA